MNATLGGVIGGMVPQAVANGVGKRVAGSRSKWLLMQASHGFSGGFIAAINRRLERFFVSSN